MSLFRIVTYIKFDPSMISNLQLWLDASTLTGVNNSGVSTWNDLSGNGANFIQSVSNYQPLLKTNMLNNQNVVRFDGTNDFLFNQSNLSMLQNKNSVTIFVVAKYPVDSNNHYSFQISDGLNSFYHRAITLKGLVGYYNATGKRLDSASMETAVSSTLATNDFVIHQAEYDYANAILTQSINGTVDGIDNPFGTAGSTSNTPSITLSLASRYQSPSSVLLPGATTLPRLDSYMNGDIAEICVFDKVLTTQEKGFMIAYFNTKWNL